MSDVFPGKHGKVGFDGIGVDAARAAGGVMSRGIALALCLTLAGAPMAEAEGATTHRKAATHATGKKSGKGAAMAGRLKLAFVASKELRPMAQQLAATRTPAAFAGVTAYAHQHSGEAAAAAYLALGNAYLQEGRFAEAAASLHQARAAGDALADYAEYLGAKAEHLGGDNQQAEALLRGFAGRNPDSIFVAQVPELEAEVLLAMKDVRGARQALTAGSGASGRVGYQLAMAQVTEAEGATAAAGNLYKHILLTWPLTADALTARARLTQLGMEQTLTEQELRTLGDAYYNAGHYNEAAEQYHALARAAAPGERNGFAVAAAACELKLKRLTREEAESLAQTNDENGARRLYLLMELARNRDDREAQGAYVEMLRTSFPRSQWLGEALFSSGNMYMLKKDYSQAVAYYSELAQRFPTSTNAPAAHWRAGWWSYRQGQFDVAERLFEEQIRLYPAAKETVSALYWRARLYEMQDHQPGLAAAHYRTIVANYSHYFYAQMARQRLAGLGNTTPASTVPALRIAPPVVPRLDTSVPDGNPHLVKAHLLVNAGLTEYVPQEIAAVPGSGSWSGIAEARMYTQYGDYFHAMRVLKKAMPYAASSAIRAIPLEYWRILFPQAYWDTIRTESARNGLDPFMVASLIRQESEFNPAAISHANAYGLMQLLPSVGQKMAREEGMGSISARQLLDPVTNIRLGTRYLRQIMEQFGGVQEYALAAYNAGDNRVTDWQAAGPYRGIDEFVESIPFTETREYVEGILRNEEIYRSIDQAGATPTHAENADAGGSAGAGSGAGR